MKCSQIHETLSARSNDFGLKMGKDREGERQPDVPDCDVQVHQFCATGAVGHDVGEAVAMLKTSQRRILERGPFVWCKHDGRVLDSSTTCSRSVRLFLRSVAMAARSLA